MSESISVLHVDDDRGFVDSAATFLERQNDSFTVVTETSPADALDRLDDERFDCIVSDYQMPEDGGLEFLEAVREDHPDVPFILFTGKGSEEIASEAVSAGVTDYMQKESRSDQYAVLANRIENAVSQYRTERTLAETRRRYETLIERSTDIISIYDREGRFEYVSPATETVLGYDPEAVRGDQGLEYIHPDDRESVREAFDRALENHDPPVTVEHRTRTAEGGWVWIESRFRNLTDDPAIDGIVEYAREVTERKQRERELERYETVIEALGDPVYSIDADGRYTFVNDAFTSLTGYSKEELLGEHTSRVVEDAAVEKGIELTRGLLRAEGTTTERCEFEAVTADGERIPCENHIALLPFDEDGEFRGTAGVIRDISERKQREQALEGLHEATRDLMAATDAGEMAEIASETAVRVLDLPYNGVHLYDDDADALVPVAWSEAGEELLGDPPPAIPAGEGLAWEAYETGTSRSYADVREAEGVLNEETPFRSELHLPLGDHGVLLAASTTTDDFDEGDEVLAQVLAANVETSLDRVEREAELHRQNERLDEFASFVSHDLRNPLRAARGRLELAREEYDDEHLEAVASAHDRMQSIIAGLLALTRKGERIVNEEPVALGDTAESCWQTVATANARLRVETDLTIAADVGGIQQLLENLFRNALDHGGADVTVRVGDLEDGRGFYVEDDGPGIPTADRNQVFKAGYTTTEEGRGLGLSIVNRIAEAHGWDVSVTEGTDGGARFEIAIPNRQQETSPVAR